MTNTNLSAPLSSENHLSLEQMHHYLNGSLESSSRHEVEMHLVDCAFCTEAMEGLALSPSHETARVLHDINRQIKYRTQRKPKNRTMDFIKDWGLATAVLFLLIISAMVVWYQVKENTDQKPNLNQKAAPINGWQNFDTYMNKHVAQLKTLNTPDKILVKFRVNTDSTISDIEISENPGLKLEKVIIQILNEGPKWVPARQEGQAISSVQSYTIRLSLKEKD